jgi:hypothetical protein
MCGLGILLLFSVFRLALARSPLFMDKTNHVVASYRLAQGLIESRWNSTWSQELPCAVPRVRGPVLKTATGSQSPTLGMTIAEAEQFAFERLPIYSGCQVPLATPTVPVSLCCHDHFAAAHASTVTLDCTHSATCPCICPSMQVWISRKWRFIFIRQPKSSSTAIMVAIKSQLCGLVDPENYDRCQLDEFKVAGAIPEETWRDFFVFTVVRNPWTRMLSAHNMFRKHFLKKCAPLRKQVARSPCFLVAVAWLAAST